jgi:hypothetical protein
MGMVNFYISNFILACNSKEVNYIPSLYIVKTHYTIGVMEQNIVNELITNMFYHIF